MFKAKAKPGFTIVELLIVIVVIAILAAIVIVAYNGVRNRATESSLKTNINGIAKQLGTIHAQNGAYPTDLSGVNNGSSGDYTYEYSGGGAQYCVTGTSISTRQSFRFNSAIGSIESGVCSGHIGYVVPGPWTYLSVGEFAHQCGIASGRAYCWGYNTNGQLGNGNGTNMNYPVPVTTAAGILQGKTVTDISASSSHTCAVASGLAYCWGHGASGQLGRGTTASSSTPVAVDTTGVLAGKTVTSISAGDGFTCALADSRVYCWGSNNYGELGDGTTTPSNVPVAVTTSGVLSGPVSAISVKRSSCALSGGQVYCWGSDEYGRLGNGGTAVNTSVPTAVDTSGVLAGKTVTKIAMGGYHVSVIADGAAFSWGYSPYGLGNGSNAQQQSPVAVSTSGVLAGKTITAIASGGYTSCVVGGGKVYCWGDGSAGHLGNDSNASSSVPVAVNDTGVLAGKSPTTLSSGTYHACALSSGHMSCWGRNNWAQLGNSGTADLWYPVAVTNP